MEAKELPSRPSLEQYKKQAKDLLKSFKSATPNAFGRIRANHPRFRKVSVGEIKSGALALADAQLVIAREHGFESWPKFASTIQALERQNTPVSNFEQAADAIIVGDITKLRELLERQPDLIRTRSTRTHRATLLHYVGANGVENYRQKTPKNAVQVCELLLGAGAEIDAMADMYGGATTLGLVATSVWPYLAGVQNDLIDTLLTHGAQINHPGAGNNQTLVNGCLANGRPDAAEHLANRGADLDLEAASGVGRLDIVQSFFTPEGELKFGATEAQLKSGFNWSCEYGRIAVVQFLLPLHPDIGAIHRGETGLHWAAYGGHVEIVKLLLDHKAPFDRVDERFGGTPLGWALYAWGEQRSSQERDRYYRVVELLIRAGAKIDPGWLEEKDRGYPLDQKIRDDPRMRSLLSHALEKGKRAQT